MYENESLKERNKKFIDNSIHWTIQIVLSMGYGYSSVQWVYLDIAPTTQERIELETCTKN